MTDFPRSHDTRGEDAASLSAYLLGGLDSEQARALEDRLSADPALRERLEATREALETLQQLDQVEPPDGFSDRLQERLVAERTGTIASGDVAGGLGDGAPSAHSLASLEQARGGRRARWGRMTPLAAAAALVVVAVLGAAVVAGLGVGRPISEDAAVESMADDDIRIQTVPQEEAGDAPFDLAEPDEPDEPDEPVEPDADFPAPDEAEEEPAELAAAPVIVDNGTVLDDEEEVRRHYAALPEAQALLGMPLEEADERGQAFTVAIRRHDEPLASGAAPDACLDSVIEGAGGPVVPVLVEAVTYSDAPGTAYVLVSASSDTAFLDRIEVWVTDPHSCDVRLFLTLPGEG